MLSHLRALLSRVPAPILIVGAALSAYSGAAVAVLIFGSVQPGAVAWMRVFIAGMILCAWRRPWRVGLSAKDLVESACFGLALITMNITFFESIAYLPLGPAVSMEFLSLIHISEPTRPY